MKKLLVLFPLLFAAAFAQAQTWAPVGAKWTYETRNPFGPEKNYQVWEVLKDTFVNGINARLVKKSGFNTGKNETFITYEDKGIVYRYGANAFEVLYDFNKKQGESWTYNNDTCALEIMVDSTATEVINGKTFRTQYISSKTGTPVFQNMIIEYLGPVSGDLDLYCRLKGADAPYIGGLRCYQDNVTGFYNTGLAPYCTQATGIHESQDITEIKLFPNPAKDKLFLQTAFTTPADYVIYNTLGQIVLKGKTAQNITGIHVNDLEKGMYFLEVLSGNQKQKQCFVIGK